eukprot:TRINITY_DN51625_c0_g1_i1.p1 TRINITY_DN51625_c0_g1~~TRINITY_DN51625_c0_g1_i1.p1  ORF type:complete len:358 (-),score=27.49 TRINITY_DN51625_c0_g1_i1:49-1122(-)
MAVDVEGCEGLVNIWMFATFSMVVFHVGITMSPAIFLLVAVVTTLFGYMLAPSTTVVTWWLLLFTAVLPQIVLLHVGYYGVAGFSVALVYWLFTSIQGRWDPDMHTAERCSARQSAFWKYLQEYFPARLHLDTEIPDGLYLFGVHPHGLWGSGVWSNLIPDRPGCGLPRRRVCTLDMNFKMPLLRDILFAMGLIGSSAKSIRKCLTSGISVMLVVGGGREATLTRPGTIDIVLKARKGFIKIALETGASLVPVLGFGETSCYRCAAGAWLWDPLNRCLLRTLGMSLPVMRGRFGTFLPFQTPLVTVVGQPIPVSKSDKPTQEQIDETHAAYTAALQALYDKYKDKFDQRRVSEMQIT